MLLSQTNLYKSGQEKSYLSLDIPWWPSGKESASNVRDSASKPGSGRSLGEGNGNPLQYSFFFFNPIDRGACGLHSAWGHNEHFHFYFQALGRMH